MELKSEEQQSPENLLGRPGGAPADQEAVGDADIPSVYGCLCEEKGRGLQGQNGSV